MLPAPALKHPARATLEGFGSNSELPGTLLSFLKGDSHDTHDIALCGLRGHDKIVRKWLRRLSLALVVSVAACGDGTFFVSFNSGVIVGPPRCQGLGGEFQMRTDAGLTLLVVITDDTTIVVAGTGGSCGNLFADASVQVSGRENAGRIVASSITVE